MTEWTPSKSHFYALRTLRPQGAAELSAMQRVNLPDLGITLGVLNTAPWTLLLEVDSRPSSLAWFYVKVKCCEDLPSLSPQNLILSKLKKTQELLSALRILLETKHFSEAGGSAWRDRITHGNIGLFVDYHPGCSKWAVQRDS